MAQSVKIHLDDMHAFLTENGFSRIQLADSTVELVYAKRVYQGDFQLSLRVYTSIAYGESRDCGEDAIRVALFMRRSDGTIVKLCGSKRVHRVVGWRKNLKDRLDNWLDYFPKEHCDKCNMPMVPRKGKFGNFIGCSNYPLCKNKKNIEDKT